MYGPNMQKITELNHLRAGAEQQDTLAAIYGKVDFVVNTAPHLEGMRNGRACSARKHLWQGARDSAARARTIPLLHGVNDGVTLGVNDGEVCRHAGDACIQ